MKFLEVSLALLQQIRLNLDEIVTVQFIHPIDDFVDNLPMVLNLLIEHSQPIHLYLSLLIVMFQIDAF